MNRRSSAIVCFTVILSAIAFSATPSLAQKTAKACEDEWKANKAENQAKKITEKAYVAKCKAEAGKPAAATPAAAPAAPAPTPAAKSSTAKPADGRQAEYARERACGKDWKADKAAGKIAKGMKWPQYWSECNTRKKAAGM